MRYRAHVCPAWSILPAETAVNFKEIARRLIIVLCVLGLSRTFRFVSAYTTVPFSVSFSASVSVSAANLTLGGFEVNMGKILQKKRPPHFCGGPFCLVSCQSIVMYFFFSSSSSFSAFGTSSRRQPSSNLALMSSCFTLSPT